MWLQLSVPFGQHHKVLTGLISKKDFREDLF